MSYQPYPGDSQVGSPVPQSITRAVQFMYVGAAASLIGIVVRLTTLSAVKSLVRSQHPSWTVSQVNTAEHVAIGEYIAVGLIGAALWIWMAQRNKAGKSWARIVATVLFGLNTLSSLAGSAAVGTGAALRIYGIVIWLIGLGAIIYLWQRPSTDYFKASSPPRY